MKKFIFVCLFIFVGFVSSQVYAWEVVGGDAWNELRILHSKYLGKYNYTTHATTDKWIAQDMNRWLESKKNEYENRIRTLEEENNSLRTGNAKLTETLKGDNNDSDETIIEQNQRLKGENSNLKGENSNLKDELECCKTLNNIAYSIIGIILVSFIAFILIKKCQAKKLPQVIEEAIAAQDK